MKRHDLIRIALPLIGLACGDPLAVRATDQTVSGSFMAFALSSAPPGYPAAIDTPFADVVPVTSNGTFDVALDLDSQGKIVLHPVRRVVTPILGSNSIGLRKVEGTFESVTQAPTGAYPRDTSIVVSPGEVVVIEAQRLVLLGRADFCAGAISSNIYSKMVVDSVNTGARTIFFRMVVDPNCGFRSFAEGIPTS